MSNNSIFRTSCQCGFFVESYDSYDGFKTFEIHPCTIRPTQKPQRPQKLYEKLLSVPILISFVLVYSITCIVIFE